MVAQKSAKHPNQRKAGPIRGGAPLERSLPFETDQDGSLAALRQKAEKRLEQQIDRLVVEKLRTGDIDALVHELCTFQIELEMQNEELRRAQEKIEKSRQSFVELYDFAPVGYFTTTPRGEIVAANLTGADMLGVARNELIGKPFQLFILEEDRDLFYLHCREIMLKKSGGSCELRLTKEDGPMRYVRLESTASREEMGKVGEIRTAVSDITARRLAENALRASVFELAAANRQLDAYSASVSHDLQAPLRAIDSFSRALLEDCACSLDTVGRDYLARIIKGTERMGRMIDNLLRLSRVTLGDMQRDRVNLSRMAENIVALFRQSQPERRIEFRIAPGMIATGDTHLLQLVLDNLLGNAIKFTGKKDEALVEFGVNEQGEKKEYFVRDNGAGLDMNYADKLFVPFQRLHSESEFPGSGIGLVTVKRIVNRHGGTVRIQGEIGKGTVVYFTL